MNATIVITILLSGGWLTSGTMSGNGLVWAKNETLRHGNVMGTMDMQPLSRLDEPSIKSHQTAMRRDPFVPLNHEGTSSLGTSEPSNVSDPIATVVPKVLGIVLGREGFGAVLQRKNGQRVFVRPGSYLKHENARVIRISDDAVSLEYRFEENGRARMIQRHLSIHGSNPAIGSPQG